MAKYLLLLCNLPLVYYAVFECNAMLRHAFSNFDDNLKYFFFCSKARPFLSGVRLALRTFCFSFYCLVLYCTVLQLLRIRTVIKCKCLFMPYNISRGQERQNMSGKQRSREFRKDLMSHPTAVLYLMLHRCSNFSTLIYSKTSNYYIIKKDIYCSNKNLQFCQLSMATSVRDAHTRCV